MPNRAAPGLRGGCGGLIQSDVMASTLTFLGAARTVTGSKYLVETDRARVLVDCGMFQGLKELRLKNWEASPVPPASIDAVVLTHAHLDHVGMLPRLVAQGFKGRIFCTPGTQDLCSLVLPDAGRLQEEEAERANRGGYSKHKPAKPLFTEDHAFQTLSRLQPVGYERPVPVADGAFEVEFLPTGHLGGCGRASMYIQFFENRFQMSFYSIGGDKQFLCDFLVR